MRKMMRIIIFLFMFLLQGVFCNAIKYEFKDGVGLVPSWVRWDECVGYCETAISTSPVVLFLYKVGEDNACGELTGSIYRSLAKDSYYTVYGPRDEANDMSPRTGLVVKYTGQSQDGNANADGIYLYDYMSGRAWVSENEADFTFGHFGSALRIEFPVKRNIRVKELVLSAGRACFATEAVVNIDANTMTPTTFSDSLSLNMGNVLIEKGDTLVAYMMIAPTDFTGDTISVKVKGSDGGFATAKVKGCNVAAGRVYNIRAMGEEEESLLPVAYNDDGVSAAKGSGAQEGVDSDNAHPVGMLTILSEATSDDGQFVTISRLVGDVNADGYVTMSDANMVVNIFLTDNMSGVDINAADVNEDGVITMADANSIVNIFLNGQNED